MHILRIYLTKGHVCFWLCFFVLLVPSFLAPMQLSNSKAQASTQNATSSVQWAFLLTLNKNALNTRHFEEEELDIKKHYDKKWVQNISRVKNASLSASTVSQSSNGTDSEKQDAKTKLLSPRELTELGLRYAGGNGVPLNQEQAVKYYTIAADTGYAQAQFLLGDCHERGNGVVVDRKKAFERYQQAALQGNTDAQFKLGVCYQYGFGTAHNLTKAITYYKLAQGALNCNPQISHSFAALTACDYADWLQQQKVEDAEEQRIKQCHDTVWYKTTTPHTAVKQRVKSKLGQRQQRIYQEIYDIIVEFPAEIAGMVAEYVASFAEESVATIKSHEAQVAALVVLSDRSFASVSDDHTIKIWKVAYDSNEKILVRCIQTILGHNSSITALIVLEHGALVSSDGGGSLKIWLPFASQEDTLWHLNQKFEYVFVTSLASLPNDVFVSGGGPRKAVIKVWVPVSTLPGIRSWQCAQTLSDDTQGITALTALRNGFASASDDESVKIWATAIPHDYSTWYCLQTLVGHAYRVLNLVTLKDGSLASASEDHTVRIWAPATDEKGNISWFCSQILEGHGMGVFALGKLPNGFLVSGSGDGSLKVWEPVVDQCGQATWRCIKTAYGCGVVCSIAVLPNANVIVGDSKGRIRIFE